MVMAPGGNLGGNAGSLQPANSPFTLGSSVGNPCLTPLLFTPDNAVDIGISGNNRPRNLYLAGSAIISGNINANQLQGYNASLAQGIQLGLGASPVNWLFGGSGAPPGGLGNNGDFYFRQDGGSLTSIYQKRSGTWTGIV